MSLIWTMPVERVIQPPHSILRYFLWSLTHKDVWCMHTILSGSAGRCFASDTIPTPDPSSGIRIKNARSGGNRLDCDRKRCWFHWLPFSIRLPPAWPTDRARSWGFCVTTLNWFVLFFFFFFIISIFPLFPELIVLTADCLTLLTQVRLCFGFDVVHHQHQGVSVCRLDDS